MTTKEKHMCGCGQEITDQGIVAHERGKRHELWTEGREVAAEGDPSLGVPPLVQVDPLSEERQNEVESGYTFSPDGPPTESPPVETELEPELQSICDSKQSPVNKAKAIRMAFSYHGWPDDEHPMSVRDVLEAGKVPYHSTFNGHDVTTTRKNRVEWEKANK